MKTGARALRSIMENIMLDIMYDLPTIEEPVEVVISAGVVKENPKRKFLLSNPKRACIIHFTVGNLSLLNRRLFAGSYRLAQAIQYCPNLKSFTPLPHLYEKFSLRV